MWALKYVTLTTHVFFVRYSKMVRLFNREGAATNRRNIRARIMANNSLLGALQILQMLRQSRVLSPRMSPEVQAIEKRKIKLIRNAFRNAGHTNALPFSIEKMINKLTTVERNARRILSAAKRNRENAARKRMNQTNRRVSVPSTRVNYGKRENGRGPNVVVISPGNNRGRRAN